jgi:O-antigen/teichoic acid export membrane protein
MKGFIKKRFVKHLVFYTFFMFLNKGMSFLLIPLFTRYLTPADYGIYALFLTAVLICEPFLSFSVHENIGNVYFDQSRFSVREYVSTFVLFIACTLFAQTVVLSVLIFSFAIAPMYLLLAPLVAFSYSMVSLVNWMWQLKEKPMPYGKFNFCYILAQLVMQICAVVFLKLGWRGILSVQGVLAVMAIAVGFTLLKKNGWLMFCFNKECLKAGLKFGLGYIPNVLAARFNDSIGRLFVAQRFDLNATGIYSVGQKLGLIVNVYSNSFISAYRPWLFKRLSGNAWGERRKIFLSVIFAFVSMMLFALGGSICMYLFSGFFLGEKFQKSLIYVFWSASAYALNGMYNIVSQFIYYTGKSWIMSLHTIMTTSLNALLTIYFLGKFGMIGAAYAPTIAWAVTLVLVIFVTFTLWNNRLSQSKPYTRE